jgi:hypothetical protein
MASEESKATFWATFVGLFLLVTIPLWGPFFVIFLVREYFRTRRHVGCLTYHPIIKDFTDTETK